MSAPGVFNLRVLNPDKMVFEGEISSLFLEGDTGEFEILPYHYPVLSLLKPGRMIIDWRYYIPLKKGLVRFFMNECVVIIE